MIVMMIMLVVVVILMMALWSIQLIMLNDFSYKHHYDSQYLKVLWRRLYMNMHANIDVGQQSLCFLSYVGKWGRK